MPSIKQMEKVAKIAISQMMMVITPNLEVERMTRPPKIKETRSSKNSKLKARITSMMLELLDFQTE